MRICCLRNRSSMDWRASSSIGARSLRSTCSAGSSPKTLGSASSAAISITSATSTYFQRGNSSMRSTWLSGASGALERALGHQLRDLRLLYLDAHAVGDLERHERIIDFGDASEDAAAGDDFIARGQARQHRL